MNNKEITLGSKSRDRISGFQGIVVAITRWLNGCVRVTIAPQELKDGKPIDSQTFDAEQLEVLEENVMPQPTSNPGGPSIAPTRSSDPR